jgi:hypothetical protein
METRISLTLELTVQVFGTGSVHTVSQAQIHSTSTEWFSNIQVSWKEVGYAETS